MITPFPYGIYRFMRLHDIDDAVKLGWLPLDVLRGTHHGDHSELCVWLCRCEMRVPVN